MLCNFFPSFFSPFCDLEQSAVQLFRELSNPALDLSRAARPNRIVVLTLMTIPPAVAEPPVGHQEERVGGGRETGREVTDWQRERQTQIDRDRECVFVMLLVSCGITKEAARRRNTETPEVLYFWTTTSSILLFTPLCSPNRLKNFFFFKLPPSQSHLLFHQPASIYLAPPAASTRSAISSSAVADVISLQALYGWISGTRGGLLWWFSQRGGYEVAVRTRTSGRRRWWRRMAVALDEVWGRVKNVCKQNGLLILSVLAVVIGCLLGFFLRGKQLSEQVSYWKCPVVIVTPGSPSHPPTHLPACPISPIKCLRVTPFLCSMSRWIQAH